MNILIYRGWIIFSGQAVTRVFLGPRQFFGWISKGRRTKIVHLDPRSGLTTDYESPCMSACRMQMPGLSILFLIENPLWEIEHLTLKVWTTHWKYLLFDFIVWMKYLLFRLIQTFKFEIFCVVLWFSFLRFVLQVFDHLIVWYSVELTFVNGLRFGFDINDSIHLSVCW